MRSYINNWLTCTRYILRINFEYRSSTYAYSWRLERDNGFLHIAYNFSVPLRARSKEDSSPQIKHARVCYRFLDAIACALVALRSHEFCNKSRARGAHLFSLPAPLSTYSLLLPSSTLSIPSPLSIPYPLSTPMEFPFRIVPRHFSRQLRSLVREIPRRSISVFFFFFLSPPSRPLFCPPVSDCSALSFLPPFSREIMPVHGL